MKRSTRFTLFLGMYIIILCSAAMAFTYFSEWLSLTGFFGDTARRCTGCFVDDAHEWGARHYWYFWMCFCLAVLSLARIFIWVAWYWNEDNPKNTKPN